MNKHLNIICKIACFICLFIPCWGCGNQVETPEPPKVVTKKIVVQEIKPKQPIKQPQEAKQAPLKPVEQALTKPVDQALSKLTGIVSEHEKDISKTTKPVLEPQSDAPPDALMIPELVVAKTDSKTDEDKLTEKPKVLASLKLDDLKIGEEQNKKAEEVKIDPFAPLFKDEPAALKTSIKTAKKKETKKRIPLTPLEKIDLSQLTLVGIIHTPSGEKALVEEASGKGYIVTRGTYVGLHSGRIIQILKDRVVIVEEIEDVLGKVTTSKKELKLLRPPGEF